MKKEFNTTGNCRQELHYLMNASQKIKEVKHLMVQGKYFTINRPRQYGKTTLLQSLFYNFQHQKDYIAIAINFQGVDGKWYESDDTFAVMFMQLLTESLQYQLPKLATFLTALKTVVSDLNTLSLAITKIIQETNKKVVLLIDEVDASSDYLPFLSFLGMLRTKYLGRFQPYHATFHSIVLAGVHDIKNLKYKKIHIENATYNSPWNIAADFKVRMSFIPEEIEPMLSDYAEAEGVMMDILAIAEQLYFYTSGYPFLVSKLCKIIAEEILPTSKKKTWTNTEVETAVRLLLKENNTNFDSLIKNLENNTDLYNLVYRLIIEGDTIPFNQYNPTIRQGILYGVFRNNGRLKVHNRIYEQLIYEYLTSKAITNLQSKDTYGGHFLLADNALDMKAVLKKFQQFMKEQYSNKNDRFLEVQGRLIFLSFLAPILNGQGYSFKEVQTSLEKRLDIIITYFQHRYIIELKQWYGEKAHQKGLDQLSDYLDIHGVKEGYLLIFDNRKGKKWISKMIQHQDKSIFAIWV